MLLKLHHLVIQLVELLMHVELQVLMPLIQLRRQGLRREPVLRPNRLRLVRSRDPLDETALAWRECRLARLEQAAPLVDDGVAVNLARSLETVQTESPAEPGQRQVDTQR